MTTALAKPQVSGPDEFSAPTGWLLIPTPITTAPMCSSIRSPPRQREKACARPDDR
jgi:hypothetical protein